jgi:hypothetical protein
MGFLNRSLGVALLGVVGCYSPDIRNCTVACTAETDCAGGQMCGSDHLCAAPVIAGHCSELVTSDAGIEPVADAGPRDGSDPPNDAMTPHDALVPPHDAWVPPIDAAPQLINLHIVINGRGLVVVNTSTCDSNGPQHGNCFVQAPRGTPATLHASAHQNYHFESWTTQACAGQGATCTFTPIADTLVGITFRRDEDQHGGND